MTGEDVADAVASAFAQVCRDAVEARGRFSCAVPGGSVAERVFPRLARLDLLWPNVDVFWVDERFVPEHDPETNLGLARRLWLDRLPAPGPRPHGMTARGQSAEAAAVEYERDLIKTVGRPPGVDVAILGVGPDGHVASLFPDHPALRLAHRVVAVVADAPKPPPVRLTLTVPALAAAREIWVVAFGAGKAGAIRAARTDPTSRLPVAIVARSGPPVRWFLDAAAEGS